MSNCSSLSCEYSVARAARWPWFSVVETATNPNGRMPSETTSRMPSATHDLQQAEARLRRQHGIPVPCLCVHAPHTRPHCRNHEMTLLGVHHNWVMPEAATVVVYTELPSVR